MSKADKKQRREAKRKQKRQEARRRESVSPVKRLAESNGEVECWMSDDFESMGQLQLLVYKRGAGLSGAASFLVDRGVVGLKDAWTRMDIERGELDNILDGSAARGIRMRRAGVEEVRRWVAGGIRWAHENGMRLPKDWAKPASLIGGVGDWASADVSAFAKEFAGHPEDLRQRLVGEPLETYLKRTDIDFQFDESAPFEDRRAGRHSRSNLTGEFDEDEEGIPSEEFDALAARLAPTAKALATETATWLAARNETPSAELPEAWTSMLIASILSKASMPEADDKEVADFGYDLLVELGGRIDESRFAEYDRAVGQTLDHIRTDPLMMQKGVLEHGLAGEETDGQES